MNNFRSSKGLSYVEIACAGRRLCPMLSEEYLGAEWEPCVPLPVASEWGSAVSLGLNPASARL